MKRILSLLVVGAMLTMNGCLLVTHSGGCRGCEPRVGSHVEFHENGVKKSEEIWEGGKLTRRTAWDDKGAKTSETIYTDADE